MAQEKDTQDFSIADEQTSVRDRETTVSDNMKQKFGLIGLIAVCVIAFYYIVFSGSDKEKIQNQPGQKVEEERAINTGDNITPSIQAPNSASQILLPPELPKLPDSPGIPDVPTPPLPKKIEPQITPSLPQPNIKKETLIQPNAKIGGYRKDRQTPMLVKSGGGVGANQSAQIKSSGINITDPSGILDPNKLEELKKSLQNNSVTVTEDSQLQRTSNQKLATRVGDLSYIVGEGKVVDAVLETAINTDLQGKIRAIVSRDVFSDSGQRILIPKGSRLIGEYSSNISFTQARVDIFWTRIILPWGIDIVIDNFPGIDQLGRAGVGGIVNNKFLNVMSTSVALAVIRVASGALVDKIMGKDDVTINNSRKKGGSKSKKDNEVDDTEYKIKASPGAVIAMQAVQDVSKQVTEYLSRYADTKPTIKIHQGTRLKVFVNQDIVFPKSAFREYNIVN